MIAFFAFAPEIRRIIYTTHAIESLHSQVRKRCAAAVISRVIRRPRKLIWLVLDNISAKWKSKPISWHAAKAAFAIQFEDRFVPEA